jgi:ribosomal protein S18 acetylase RimI-like enzyme
MTDAPCRKLDWDTEFFGLPIAQVNGGYLTPEIITEVLRWSRDNNISCLYFLCAPDDDYSVRIAEENGFHLVDVRVELSWRAHKVSDESNIIVRHFEDSDIAELLEIASQIYKSTRFYYDKQFTESQASALYREWITKSCNGYADTVLVSMHENTIGGFITCHVDSPERGRIGLVGVSDYARDNGIGRSLLKAAQQYFFDQGVRDVFVVTQARNIAAQRLYQAHGFRTYSTHLWYHKWLNQRTQR